MAVGVFASVAVLVVAALVIPGHAKTKRAAPDMTGCYRYFLVPVEWICGKRVFWVNPDGSRVLLGLSDQLRMPRPRPVHP